MKSIYISSCVPDGGVWRCGFDGETLTKRDFSPVGRVMYTAREGDTIYAVSLEPDSLDSFVVQAKLTDGRPGTFGGRIRTGRESCFIDVRDGDFYTADYSSAGVTKNGARTVTHTGCGSDPSRQEAPHPHQALLSPDGRYVLVCDLGLDRVFVYDRELTLVSQADAPKGQGIRHLVFAPDGKQVYAVNELGCSVTEFRWSDGELTALRTTPFPWRRKKLRGRRSAVGERRSAVHLPAWRRYHRRLRTRGEGAPAAAQLPLRRMLAARLCRLRRPASGSQRAQRKRMYNGFLRGDKKRDFCSRTALCDGVIRFLDKTV